MLPLGGEPTVKTTPAGLDGLAPPPGGATGEDNITVLSVHAGSGGVVFGCRGVPAVPSHVGFSPTARPGPNAAFSSMSDKRPALWDLHAGNNTSTFCFGTFPPHR